MLIYIQLATSLSELGCISAARVAARQAYLRVAFGSESVQVDAGTNDIAKLLSDPVYQLK